MVTGHTAEGGILCDRTVFYATGGGQPGDSGLLVWEGGRLSVATAVKAEGGQVALVPAEPSAMPPIGTRVCVSACNPVPVEPPNPACASQFLPATLPVAPRSAVPPRYRARARESCLFAAPLYTATCPGHHAKAASQDHLCAPGSRRFHPHVGRDQGPAGPPAPRCSSHTACLSRHLRSTPSSLQKTRS